VLGRNGTDVVFRKLHTKVAAYRQYLRRLQNLPPFVVTRGGEYCFAPGLRAMRWLAELGS
jgi:hypothetical protein